MRLAATLFLAGATQTSAQPAGAEWIGVFDVSSVTSPAIWSMEKVNGTYADASMKIAFIPTTDPDAGGLETAEAGAATLLAGSCPDTAPGAITIAAEGSCFNFIPDDSLAQSTWSMDLTGVTGVVVAAQHLPTEFEDIIHYFYDSANTETPADSFMIEPVAQEGGGGGSHGHSHGHSHGGDMEICSCAAGEEDHPFSLSCDDAAAITASAETLAACDATEEGCEVVVDGIMTCRGAFFHLHYIHVWCSEDTMTNAQDELVHNYEAACPMCEIFRAYDASVPDCVQPTCADVATADAAAAVLTDAGCVDDGGAGTCCRDDAEIAAFRTVLAYHDMCDHDDVPQSIEMAKHDFGMACEAFSCNLQEEGYAGDVCATAVAETVSGEMSFAATMAEVEADRAGFEGSFKEALVAQFGTSGVTITASDVTVTDIVAGSVVVSYSVAVPCGNDCTAAATAAATANDDAVAAAEAGSLTVGSYASEAPAPPPSTTPPPAPPPSDSGAQAASSSLLLAAIAAGLRLHGAGN